MLSKIIEFSVRNKLIVGLFIIALIIYGGYQTTRLPIDAVPDITNNQVQVITVAPSFGATDIERLITFPIEQANSNINGLKEIRSFSRFGLSLVTIVFDDETDLYWARQQVAERLQKVQSQIPKGIGEPEMGPISTGLGEIYQYVVRAKEGYENKYDQMELRTIQDWVVRRQLLGVKGVAEVSSFGGKLKQYEIAINPNKIKSYNITINDVFTALEKNNQNTGGAYIEKGPTVLFIRSEGLIGTKEDIGNIAIKSTESGTPLLIRDVADINIGFATRYGAMCYNDKGEVAGAVVMMLKGANASQVIKNVKERIIQIQKSLPEGVVVEPFLDRTKMVNNAIGTVKTNLIEGALIVLFVLVLFLGNLRAGFIIASVIPLAMLFAIIMMNIFGVVGNLMSLGALDFGLIIDGAVFVVEASLHHIAHSKSYSNVTLLTPMQMDNEVENSSKKIARSVVFGQVIILIVYLPTFSLQGIERKMFVPMAQTVAFALLGAFILSLTYVPMISSLILSKKVNHKLNLSDRIMLKVEILYQHLLSKVLRIPKVIIGSILILFVFAIFILSTLGGEFIPALEEGDFAVDTRLLSGSNLKTTIETTQKAAHILKSQFPEVEKVVTKIGNGEVPTDPMPMEASDMMIILKDKSQWTSAKTFNELSEKMSNALQAVPGVTTSFQYPVQMRFNELMTGARQDVVCKIFGENLDTLAKFADQLGKVINTVQGSQNLFVEPVTGMPQIIIEYNRNSISQYNLNIEDINRVLNTAFAGQSAGLVFEGEKRFDLVLRLQSGQRSDLDDVKNLLIPTPQGTQIPLYQLASVQIKNGPNQIQREDAKRRIVVGFNVKNRDVQSIVNELQDKFDKQIKLPAGYYITYGGAFENLNAAKARLMIAVPVSLLLIFILLFFAFNSFKQSLLIYSAIPLSAIGGILFLALRGMPFSISAGVGFIALFGVAVLNGIVLISEFNRLKSEGWGDLHKIVLMGTKIRLRPVLMTAFVAALGFMPMAVSTGAGAEVQKPLATVVIGGLMIATFLTLFVLPLLYIIFEKSGKSNKKADSHGNIHGIVVVIIGLLIFNNKAVSENFISLKAATDIALKNNLTLKNERLKSEYQKRLTGTSFNIPSTNVFFENGQINSIYSDNRIGISQSFSLPTVYSNQRDLLNQEWKSAVLASSLKESEIRKNVAEIFSTYLILKEKEKILILADSIYSEFTAKSNIRFEKGESNLLEKASAESQKGNISLQLKAIREEIEIIKIQFQLILNTGIAFEPKEENIKLEYIHKIDTNKYSEHPILQYFEQQKNTANSAINLEKSRLLPEFNLGYFNMSMKGLGPDNVLYSSNTRFSSYQIGIGIPLFFSAQSSRIDAFEIGKEIAENNYDYQYKQLNSQYQSAIKQYISNLQTIEYYEKSGLNNSKLIIETANTQYSKGEINYLEWVMLANQSISVRSNYIDAIGRLNQSIITLNYLINSK